MKPSAKTDFALLGLLTLGPASGYDLKRLTETSLRFFWNESFGQIYPALKRLEAQGLATAQPSPQRGRRARQVYAITDAGRATLKTWLAEPVDPQPPRLEILLKLFFGRQAGEPVNRRHLRGFRQRHQAMLAQLDAIQATLNTEHNRHPDLPFWLITLDFGRRMAQMALDWCDAAEASLPKTRS